MANADPKSTELKLDPDKLYLEEVLTDRRIGTLRRLTPVTRDGTPDATRAVTYVGETQILTPAGSIPIAFEIEASSLGEAAEKFGDVAKEASELFDRCPARPARRRGREDPASLSVRRYRISPDFAAISETRRCSSRISASSFSGGE
jgi:hypothetical protein